MSSTIKRQLLAFAGFACFFLFHLFDVQDWDQRYLFSGITATVTVFLLHYTFANLKRARLIEDTPTSKIRSAAQGYVELCGIAELPEKQTLLAAALTQTPCLWFRFIIEEYKKSGRNTSWHIIEHGESEHYFELNDKSGQCLIDPRHAETTSLHKQIWQGNSRHPLLDETNAFLGIFASGKRYRYSEWRIHEGDVIYSLGHLATQRSASMHEQIKQRQAEILAALKHNKTELMKRYDSNRDGDISIAEWERARRHAQFNAEKEVQKTLQDQTLSILGANNAQNNQPFILSAIDPEILARRFRWQAFGCALGFVAGCFALTWLIGQLLGINVLA